MPPKFPLLAFALLVSSLAALAADPVVVDRARFFPAPEREQAMVGGKFSGSNVSPSEGFKVLAEIKTAPPGGEWSEISFTNTAPYRWVRYEAPAGSRGNLAELEFYAGPNKLRGGGFGTAGFLAPGGNWKTVFDGKEETWFNSNNTDGQSVGIDLEDQASTARPVIAPGGGDWATPQVVTMKSPTAGATIRYTLDGTTPGAQDGQLYTAPFTIEKNTTLVAVAAKDGLAPSPASVATIWIGPPARPPMSSFHVGNSLTGNASRYRIFIRTAGGRDDFPAYLIGGSLTVKLWNESHGADQARWDESYAKAVHPLDYFTLQPRDFNVAEEADYATRFIQLVREKSPDVQPWLYAEWVEMERMRPSDKGEVPSFQMKKTFPALTWEESMSAMLLYNEEVQHEIAARNHDGKRVRILPTALALGWARNLIDQGKFPGVPPGEASFYATLFEDHVHVNPNGCYLVALTWYAALYRESPEGKLLPIGTTLTSGQARVLQRLAWEVVRNYPDCGLYEEGSAPTGEPQFTRGSKAADEVTRVTLSSTTPDAAFRYTLDGTPPTRTRGYVYCGVISARPGMTVKAVAYRSGLADSAAAETTLPEAARPVGGNVSPSINSLGMKLVRLEPGTFTMGQDGPAADYNVKAHPAKFDDADWDERPAHRVTISGPFSIGATEVTCVQYRQFQPQHAGGRGADEDAVTGVSWDDAVKFCAWLSAKEKRTYRLPTEAEWEYACRAGTTTLFHTGDRLPDGFHQWFADLGRRDRFFPGGQLPPEYRAGAGSLRVAQTPPNAWGLYDLHGNAAEWCADWYGPYEAAEQTDPLGRSDGDFRVIRGGSHSVQTRLLRSANRGAWLPETSNEQTGFRVVLGELPRGTMLPPAAPALNAQHVDQRRADSPARPAEGPFFSGPKPFVKIPPNSFGPLFSGHNHSPAIAECPNGDLLAIWYSCVDEAGTELNNLASRLRRGTSEWEPASLFWDGADVNDHAPKLWWDGERTLFHFAHGLAENIVRTSTDNGATWSKARAMQPAGEFGNAPIRTREGTMVITQDVTTTSLNLSRDGGVTWSFPAIPEKKDARRDGSTFRHAGIHAPIVQLADGSLMTVGRLNSDAENAKFGSRCPRVFRATGGRRGRTRRRNSPRSAACSVRCSCACTKGRCCSAPLPICAPTGRNAKASPSKPPTAPSSPATACSRRCRSTTARPGRCANSSRPAAPNAPCLRLIGASSSSATPCRNPAATSLPRRRAMARSSSSPARTTTSSTSPG